ncbi:MAG: phage major capsid protein [Rickettsiaceae bacterium H1]|nr:phage major capsid protein [Rickettsiaceae bacterium H1]
MHLTEITKTVNQLANAWEEFKIVNDRRLKDLEKKGSSHSLDDEYISRLNNAIDECKNRISTIENSSERPVLDQNSSQQQNSFCNYLRTGVNKSMLEQKFLGNNQNTGFPLTHALHADLTVSLQNNSIMRQIASVEKISSDYVTFFIPTDKIAATWGDQINDKSLPSLTPQDIRTHVLHACPTITQRLLEDSAVNIDKWIIDNLSEAFSAAENQAFFNGDGNGKPQGILKSEIKRISFINKSTESNDFTDFSTFSADDIVNLYYSLGEEYANNACFVMHRSTAQHIRSIKSSTGQYLWQPGLQNNFDTLMGAPIYQSAEMPEIKQDKKVIAFGDFKRGYKIIDRTEINILRDQFSCKPNIAFYATKRVGGKVVDDKAVAFLQMKVARR